VRIETKFSVGDIVFHGRAGWVGERVECPACKGSGWWTVVAHSGERGQWQATCQVCRDYREWGNVRGRGPVKRGERHPTVTRLTIGSVRVDRGVEYMCRETGVGSGSVYREEDLFDTKSDARAHAERAVLSETPEALRKDLEREERLMVSEMHHCQRPTRVETRKRGPRDWSAFIQGEVEVTRHSTEKNALKALAEKLAEWR
jgi:hypothetical protein